MFGNLSLLTVLFIMCYFIKKGRNYAVTTITRAQRDYFTDVCKNCYKYGAVPEQGICKCKPTSSTAGLGSLFLRYERHCKNEDDLMLAERCQLWRNKYLEVIDTEGTKSYIFIKGSYYTSYQLEPFISYRNSTTGEWQSFNLSGNVLVLQNGPDPSYLQIKVTRLSPNLTKFKGYVIKLGLKRTKSTGETEESCLLFKAKGEIHFPLNCRGPTMTPSVSTTTTTTTASPSTTTVIPSATGSTTTIKPIDDGDIAVIVIATVLCLSLICLCVFVVVYRDTYIRRSRGLPVRNPDNDFDGNEFSFSAKFY